MSSYVGSSNGIGEVTKSQQKGTECQKRINLLVCYLSKVGKLYLNNIYIHYAQSEMFYKSS